MERPRIPDRLVPEAWSRRRKLTPFLSEIALELLRHAHGSEAVSTQTAASGGIWIEEVSGCRPAGAGGRIRRLKPVIWKDNNRVGESLKVGKRWWVAESAGECPPMGRKALFIQPGMGFGTGRHETTRLCLEQLEAMSGFSSLLDLGTGSGILAIAAWRLGVQRIEAMDHDVGALRNARENGRLNHSRSAIRWSHGDLARWRPKGGAVRFQVVTANLLADLLVTNARRIASWLVPGGRLMISGFFRSQRVEVEAAFRSLGMRMVRRGQRGRWAVSVLRQPFSFRCRNNK